MVFSPEIVSYVTIPCLAVTLVSILYSNYGVILAVIRKRKYSVAMLLTLLLILVGAVNDILFSYNLIHTEMIIKYAYLISVILQSIILSQAFVDYYEE